MTQKLNTALLDTAANTCVGVGLNASFTGSVATSVLRFTTVTTTGRFTVATTATEGTIVTVNEPGVYTIELGLDLTGALALNPGIGINTPAGFSGDPAIGTNGMIRAKAVVGVAALTMGVELSATTYIGGAAAGATTIKLCASNPFAGAPSGLTLATGQFRIVQVAKVVF